MDCVQAFQEATIWDWLLLGAGFVASALWASTMMRAGNLLREHGKGE